SAAATAFLRQAAVASRMCARSGGSSPPEVKSSASFTCEVDGLRRAGEGSSAMDGNVAQARARVDVTAAAYAANEVYFADYSLATVVSSSARRSASRYDLRARRRERTNQAAATTIA